ncbi:MAG TPA: FHA domain-containing protein, partial [Kofleriaceae bacterium]
MAFDRRTLIQTGLAMQSTRSRTAPRAYSLQVLDQSAANVTLGARPVVVGAQASCDLVLSDPQVSRRHAELAITPDGIRLKDLGSTNGTWYQGTRVTEVVVPAGSTIKFGGTPVRVAAA